MRNAADFLGLVAYLSLMYPWLSVSSESVPLSGEVNHSDDKVEAGPRLSLVDAAAATPADVGQDDREAGASAA